MSIPLQASLLLSSNQLLCDVKSEIVLTMCLRFFEDYTLSLAKNEEDFYGVYDVGVDGREHICNVVVELRDYLRDNVISREKLQSIMSNATKSQKHMILAKQYEPHGVFHDYLANSFQNILKQGMAWIPEFLAFYLIYQYRIEKEAHFAKHKFIQEYDLLSVLEIYDRLNFELKKDMQVKNPNTKIWEHRTIIDSMIKTAEKMIEDYLKKSYKVNINRVSKVRKRK